MIGKTILLILTVLINYGVQIKGNDGCKHCDKEITDVLKLMAESLKIMEPIRSENKFICKIVEVTGISSIQHNNKSCIKKVGDGPTGPCYFQSVEIRFGEIRLGCRLHDSPLEVMKIIAEGTIKAAGEAAKAAGKKMFGALGDLGKNVGIWGKRSADPPKSMSLNASWIGLRVELEMKLCFEDDIYNLTNIRTMDTETNGLSLWCEGDQGIGSFCSKITEPEIVRNSIGFIANMCIKLSIGQVLNIPNISDQISTLNCGYQDEDDE